MDRDKACSQAKGSRRRLPAPDCAHRCSAICLRIRSLNIEKRCSFTSTTWTGRTGSSLAIRFQVMASLARRETLAGKVQIFQRRKSEGGCGNPWLPYREVPPSFWFLANILGLFSNNVVPSGLSFSINVVHSRIRSTSLSVISSFVRSYNLVVRGDSCPAICWACSSRPSFSR